MSLWVSVSNIADGEQVNAETINRPLNALTTRTAFLYDQLQNAIGTAFESVRLANVPLFSTDLPAVGDVVYLDSVSGTYKKAIASTDTLDVFVAAAASYSRYTWPARRSGPSPPGR